MTTNQPLDFGIAPTFAVPAPLAASDDRDLNDGELFVPRQPKSLVEVGLEPKDLFPLILRFLYFHGPHSGAAIARQMKMPVSIVEPVVVLLKQEQWIGHKGAAPGSDYVYELTPKGAEQARMAIKRGTYCGAAPVSIEQYEQAMLRQSVRKLTPPLRRILAAYQDMILSKTVAAQLAQAVTSGRSLLLYGPSGNGKSSIASRLIHAWSSEIWIPRALFVGGEVLRLFDSAVHREMPVPRSAGYMHEDTIDQRWVRIARPAIVVGGELCLEHLEPTLNPVSQIIESPLHLKSNGGCLVIDDFGRQRIHFSDLLNRWIIPMDRGFDFVNLPSGRQIRIPFDQLLVFATNLKPKDIADDAFFRRIPYKIELMGPNEEQFRKLFERLAQQSHVEVQAGALDYLLEKHFERSGRVLCFSFAGDLLQQAIDFCKMHNVPARFNREIADLSVLNYFADR
ncbi:MAG TPA: AAA family ATPase [Pirellulaceae bacterium]|nr:AAA family ATPase [Pirellulaceae bacterium]